MPTRTSYDEFKDAAPGKRFQRLHECRTQRCESCRPAMIAGGAFLCATGVVLLVLPGPGILLIVIGLALIAQESMIVARALDHVEVLGRKSWHKIRRCFTTS
jgi:hypothetical protein